LTHSLQLIAKPPRVLRRVSRFRLNPNASVCDRDEILNAFIGNDEQVIPGRDELGQTLLGLTPGGQMLWVAHAHDEVEH
jgi:hypothetical protein